MLAGEEIFIEKFNDNKLSYFSGLAYPWRLLNHKHRVWGMKQWQMKYREEIEKTIVHGLTWLLFLRGSEEISADFQAGNDNTIKLIIER